MTVRGVPDKRGGGYLSQASPHLEIGGRISKPSLLNSRAFDDTFVAVMFVNLGGYGWVEEFVVCWKIEC